MGPLARMPSRAVKSLPWDFGGLQRADVPAQVQALHAAMLVHSRRRSWKLLMRRAFERYLPALGPAVLVSSLAAANAPGRSPEACRLLAGFLSVEAAQAAGTCSYVTAPAPAGAACQQLPHH